MPLHDRHQIGAIMGNNGHTINALCASSGASISFSERYWTMSVIGTEQEVRRAVSGIEQVLVGHGGIRAQQRRQEERFWTQQRRMQRRVSFVSSVLGARTDKSAFVK